MKDDLFLKRVQVKESIGTVKYVGPLLHEVKNPRIKKD